MSLEVNGKCIETDNEGHLIDPSNWDTDVMKALIKQHENDGHRPLSETAIGLVHYFREYFDKNQKAPRMNEIINDLGRHPGESFSDAEEYKKFLYEMFPHGPIQKLSKLAGLPNLGNENES